MNLVADLAGRAPGNALRFVRSLGVRIFTLPDGCCFAVDERDEPLVAKSRDPVEGPPPR